VEGSDAGVVEFQVPPELLAQCPGQVAQGGVVQLGAAGVEVVDQQRPHWCRLDLVEVDQFLDGALAGQAGLPERAGSIRAQQAGLEQQRVEQARVDEFGAVDDLERADQLQAVPDRDVADSPALVEQDPSQPVQSGGSVTIGAASGQAVGLKRGEPVRVEGAPGLPQHLCEVLQQQEPVSRSDDLPAQHQQHATQQAAPMVGPASADVVLHWQEHPVPAEVFSATGQPTLLPGLAGLPIEPVQHPSQTMTPSPGVSHRWPGRRVLAAGDP
jgi:hypothetical protein